MKVFHPYCLNQSRLCESELNILRSRNWSMKRATSQMQATTSKSKRSCARLVKAECQCRPRAFGQLKLTQITIQLQNLTEEYIELRAAKHRNIYIQGVSLLECLTQLFERRQYKSNRMTFHFSCDYIVTPIYISM